MSLYQGNVGVQKGGNCALFLCMDMVSAADRCALREYGLKHFCKTASFSPVQVSTGFPCVLQKILRVLRRNSIVLSCLAMAVSPFVVEGRKSISMSKEKNLGQIFTPGYLVNDILDVAGYKSVKAILGKHIIDNSCGDGAFLVEVVRRYCRAAIRRKCGTDAIKRDLETFVHGIELDEQAYRACLAKLDEVAATFALPKVSWDIRHGNTLDVDIYDGRMDYVVGNPPYVRVHNLENNFRRVKQYRFCTGGMTDLYLVFYEIGLKMLKDGGRLCYIAPSSWFNSLAGHNMREFAKESGWLREIIDLGHFQPFRATTYTAIVLFEKSRGDGFSYKTYSGPGAIVDVARLCFRECYFDNALYLGDKETVATCREIKTGSFPEYVDVKNGFATLADNVFIADGFPFDSMIIPVIKASTGKWRKAFYPYDKKGKPLPRKQIFADKARAEYIESKKDDLLKGRAELNFPGWYLYGRTQALKDVWVDKYAINTVIRDVASVKLNKADAGSGVYSGLYILSDVPESQIRDVLLSDDFINYIRVLKKYKSGGYYTFSSKDLRQFLNFQLCKKLGGRQNHRGKPTQQLLDL